MATFACPRLNIVNGTGSDWSEFFLDFYIKVFFDVSAFPCRKIIQLPVHVHSTAEIN